MPREQIVESSFRCRQVYNGLHLIAAELILDVREGGHRSDDKDGVGVLIPNFKMTRSTNICPSRK